MKLLYTFLLFIITVVYASAQNFPANAIVKRKIQYHIIGKDSVNLSLNERYDIIEDSCAQIIRYAHYDFRTRKFHGPVKDVSKLDPKLVLMEGTYNDDGLKTGIFTSYYLNGKLESKGTYKAGKYDGHWETFDVNGKPVLTFDADNGIIKIIDAWTDGGKKYIDNGKGNDLIKGDYITWKGKLDNGKPDGTWHAYKTDDATQTSLVDEHFKKGIFVSGSSPTGDYTDASRILLVNPDMLPYTHTEKMQISTIACNGTGFKHIVDAQYAEGLQRITDEIQNLLTPYFTKTSIASYDNELVINGEISEKGNINRLTAYHPFDDSFAQGIINRLNYLPRLQPATVEGKPVVQKFRIKFTFNSGTYRFTYNFLQIKQDI